MNALDRLAATKPAEAKEVPASMSGASPDFVTARTRELETARGELELRNHDLAEKNALLAHRAACWRPRYTHIPWLP